MKKLILTELLLLFLATTFVTDSPPPGWYEQALPVNDFINDIFFLDSLNGWVVTQGNYTANDTSYIMRTTNGGANWTVQKSGRENLNAVQFLDINTGYAGGGTNGTVFETFYKTTNSGVNWLQMNVLTGVQIKDLFFINKDTGWVCDDNSINGSLNKTTDGGLNWVQQLNNTYRPLKLFFINKDTGWVGTNEANARLYNTTNGGISWNSLLSNIAPVESIFFFNSLNGWMRAIPGSNGISYTTNGGINWTNSQGDTGGYDIKFVSDSIGYTGMVSNRILKSTDAGRTWGHQTSPIYNNLSISMIRDDTLNGWAGGTGIVKTTDGGGPITFTGVQQISTEVPSEYNLYQNYPNPFNPVTNIKYQITKNSGVQLKIFNIQGKEITTLVNQEQKAGTYEADWNASNYPSGVYFYQLTIFNEQSALIYRETKKMILIK